MPNQDTEGIHSMHDGIDVVAPHSSTIGVETKHPGIELVLTPEERLAQAGIAIEKKYAQLGGKASPLGLPVNPTAGVQLQGTTYLMDYRGGQIESSGGTSATAVKMREVQVWWVGLECRIRQESSDEIYGSVGAVVPASGGSFTHKFPGDRDYWDMGRPGERIVNVGVPIYTGPPADVVIVGALVEHDSGNIDKYKQKFADEITRAAQGLAGMEGVPAEATAADEGWLNTLSLGLVNGIFSLVGADDDAYVPGNLLLHWTDILGHAFPKQTLRRDDDPRTIEYTHQLIVSGVDQGGDRGEYALYFDVRQFDITPVNL